MKALRRSVRMRAALAVALAMLFSSRLMAATVNVVELTAQDIQAGLASSAYTSVDLVNAYLARIDELEPLYNAFIALNPSVLADAAALDAEYALTGPRSPLHGVPIAIKDSMNVAGLPTTGGYGGFVDVADGGTGKYLVPVADSPIVERLRAAGAIILGKTNMPVFARSGSNANNSFYGPTFNSYNTALLPGGSSTGSAVATSLSMATMGTAEETGGSIQHPAGANGLVGVKTTFGLVPTSGGIPLSGSTRDVFGPNAKSVWDAAAMLDVIAGYDHTDIKTLASVGNIPPGGYLGGLSDTALAGKRIGLWGPGWKNRTVNNVSVPIELTPDTQALYDAAVDVLEAQGATVVENPFLGSNLIPLMSFPGGGNSLPYDIHQFFQSLGGSNPSSAAEFKAMTGVDIFQANGPLVGNINAALTAALADPTVLPDINPFMEGREIVLAEFRRVMDALDLDALFYPQMWSPLEARVGGSYRATTVSEINVLGTPAVNLPGGYYPDGSPFSVQFLGDMWSEGELLSLAYDFEQATNFRTAPVPVPEPATLLLAMCCGAAAAPRFAARRREREAAGRTLAA
ncbi:MAG TPA: amidase [Lacipirellulaceae bacterium]|nr:amidase [Lacipirellulaceae bacterium]